MNAIRNRILRGLHRGGITAAASLLFAATTAWGQEAVIKRPPCEIGITAVGPYYHNTNPSADGTPATDQSRADVARVKAALEEALEQSEDMRTKVDDACKKQKNKMQILVFRDTTIVSYGHVEYSTIRLDLGDIDDVGSAADDALAVQEAGGEFEVVSGSPHRDSDTLLRRPCFLVRDNPYLHRFFGGQTVVRRLPTTCPNP